MAKTKLNSFEVMLKLDVVNAMAKILVEELKQKQLKKQQPKRAYTKRKGNKVTNSKHEKRIVKILKKATTPIYIPEVISKLGLTKCGSSYRLVKKVAKAYNLKNKLVKYNRKKK